MWFHMPDDTRKLDTENQAQTFAEISNNAIRVRFGSPHVVDGQTVYQRRDQSSFALSFRPVTEDLYDCFLEVVEHLTVEVSYPIARCRGGSVGNPDHCILEPLAAEGKQLRKPHGPGFEFIVRH